MGRSNRRKGAADQFDSSDTESVSSASTAFSEVTVAHDTEVLNSQDYALDKFIDALYEKRGSTRETALSGLVNAFESNMLSAFVENKCITLLHQFLNSIKKGSTKEACLASRAIGLLAITVGSGNSSHEIMEESLPHLSKVLLSGSDASKMASVLDCLAVVTFVGAIDLAETETSLKAIWEVIHPKPASKVGAPKRPPAVLAAALSAWSFLVTTISAWRINPDTWKEPVWFLSTLLDAEDRAVRMAAGEAIAVCFEIGILNVYSNDESDTDNLDIGDSKRRDFLYMQSMKAKIADRANNLSMEAGGKGTDKKNLNDQRDLFQKIWDFIKSGESPEASVKISSKHGVLRVSSWTELIQLNFLKRFLGRGFLKHAQENELLHDIFDFGQDITESLSTQQKRISSKISSKGRTLKLNKDRKMAQERKGGILLAQDG
ncbi:interferon-related developmental regulator 2 [Ananas comosus]|uniref:Interferon-related developmental regulator 2 n=1 Tax=Ananas comosus TaxID=4615 RepID=A0A6P5GFC0_ANACO|nr:interferon-related developmental regulator 2 [Ananas comosus]